MLGRKSSKGLKLCVRIFIQGIDCILFVTKNLIQNMNDILIHFNNPRAHSVIYDVKAHKMKTQMINRLNSTIKMHAILGKCSNSYNISIMYLLHHKMKFKYVVF